MTHLTQLIAIGGLRCKQDQTTKLFAAQLELYDHEDVSTLEVDSCQTADEALRQLLNKAKTRLCVERTALQVVIETLLKGNKPVGKGKEDLDKLQAELKEFNKRYGYLI